MTIYLVVISTPCISCYCSSFSSRTSLVNATPEYAPIQRYLLFTVYISTNYDKTAGIFNLRFLFLLTFYFL